MVRKLVLDIQKIGNYGLSVKVLYQSASLKDKGIVLSNGKQTLKIYNRPELTEDTLYVRGVDDKGDREVVTHFYQTKTLRDEMYHFASTCEKVLNGLIKESFITHPTLKITEGDCFYVENLFVQYVGEEPQVINLCPIVKATAKIPQAKLKLLPTLGDDIYEKVNNWEYAGNVLVDNRKAA